MKLGDIFATKVVSAGPKESLAVVARLMEQHNVTAVVIVVDQKPIGLVTERDLALALGARGTPPQTCVERVMHSPVATIEQHLGVFHATEQMSNHRVRRLPLVDDEGCLVGIVTLDDLLKLLAGELSNLAQGISVQPDVPWYG